MDEELQSANEKLLRAAREELSDDLRRMMRLHEVSTALRNRMTCRRRWTRFSRRSSR